ncbi:MAG: SH3 domain-containing protein [Chloroflexi bacterium]|nr:SH3 domain-containing protein [Chloroflexota bacterium]
MMVACNFSSMTPVESAQSGANAVSTQVAQTVEAQVIATQIAARNTAVAGMPDTVTAEPGVVETQIAMTVAAQGNEANAELAATTAALVAVERQMERTAVALASTQTANNYIQQTRNAQEALALQQANATPAVRAILDSVNVRSGPGTEYQVISNLRNNDIVPVVAKSGDGEWFIVEMPGGFRGWVHDSVTDPVLAQAMLKWDLPPPYRRPPPSRRRPPTPPRQFLLIQKGGCM